MGLDAQIGDAGSENSADKQQLSATAKKTYKRPTLIIMGSLQNLTQGGFSASLPENMDGTSMP